MYILRRKGGFFLIFSSWERAGIPTRGADINSAVNDEPKQNENISQSQSESQPAV